MEVTYLRPPWLTESYHPRCNSDAGAASGEPGAASCGWSVASVTKRVDKACADASIYEYIEARGRGSSVIMSPPFWFVWRIPIKVTHSSDE